MPATSIISKRDIPKDLQGISGVKTGFDPVPIHQARLVIIGLPGSGKSTLLNSFPGLFMIDPEDGGNTVAEPLAIRYTAPPETPEDQIDLRYLELIDKIIARKRAGKNDIQMIGIDTYDELILRCQKGICRRENLTDIGDFGGGHGKGYFVVRDLIFDALDRAHNVGLGWAIVAHTKKTSVEVGGRTIERSGLSVSDSYKGILWQRCEHMLFFDKSEEVVKGKLTTRVINGKTKTIRSKSTSCPVHILRTQPGGLWSGSDAQDIKTRIPLPEKIVIPEKNSFGVLTEAYNEAIRKLTGEENNG